ncbi:MFS transporter [Dactylosporangium sp. AC04546]|uniref:MFS transporter n=1 Tax=Dactylosporangium sp. AC04546 TaxID=2862460 RepID=UPI001EE0C6E6|nr:MFS transporter [Dactylosporangium sp. AC04546]WVK88130.1 MFS transporter [Dactylosporangium sp. AC04546]
MGMLAGPRPLRTLVVTVSGLGLLYLTWTLVGPFGLHIGHRYDFTSGEWALLGTIPVVVGVLARIPAGMFADRFGAHVVVPAVSVVAALTVLALELAHSVLALVGVACAVGLACAAFPAGVGAIIRAFPPGRRGPAMSLFAAAMCFATAVGIASRVLPVATSEVSLRILAGTLLGYALLALWLLRGDVDRSAPPGRHPAALALIRAPATRHLAVWFGVSGGGITALDLTMPSYLTNAYGLSRSDAIVATGVAVALSAAAAALSGWLTRRHDPMAVLRGCWAAVAPLLLLLAFHPPLAGVAAPALAGVAVGIGVAWGTACSLIGRAAPARHAGATYGAVSAMGTAIAMLPALLVIGVYGIDRSYTIALMLLAGGAVASAGKLHASRRWLSAAMHFPVPTPAPPDAALTVVSLSGRQTRSQFGDVISALAALATRHELVVVFEPDPPSGAGQLITCLRMRLPAHTILALSADTPPHPHEIATVSELLEVGAVPVVLVAPGDAIPAALMLGEEVHADQVVHLTPDRVDGLVHSVVREVRHTTGPIPPPLRSLE